MADITREQYEQLRQQAIDAFPTEQLAKMAAFDAQLFFSLIMPDSFYRPFSEFHMSLLDVVSHNQRTGRRECRIGPRGWGKSTTVTEGGSIYVICRNAYLADSQRYKFILITSDTTSQAEARLATIKANLESNPHIAKYYPHAFGRGRVWRTDMILTNNNVCIATAGMTTAVRGIKFEDRRPDIIFCHRKGTRILHDNQWIPVEEHPSFRKYRECSGVNVQIYGLPFAETVTPEHRYMVRTILPKTSAHSKGSTGEPGWKEAETLGPHDYIGYPIDMSVWDIPDMPTYAPAKTVTRDKSGRFTSTENVFENKPYLPMRDARFWWIVGYWWGTGSTIRHAVLFHRDKRHPEHTRTLKKMAKAVGLHLSEYRSGQIHIHDSVMARWLRTWVIGKNEKVPPAWVEHLPVEYQQQLLIGYAAADGYINRREQQVCIVSVCLEQLLSARRILMRIGVPCSIRKGRKAHTASFKNAENVFCRPTYELRMRDNAHLLGFPVSNQYRYAVTKVHIADGYMWHKVRNISDMEMARFCPITTDDHTYITHFGLSHNCDDVDSMDTALSPTLSSALEERFNRDLLKCGHDQTDVLVVGTVLSKQCLCYKLTYNDEYGAWNSMIYRALKAFPTDMKLWDRFGNILLNRKDPDRKKSAEAFYMQNKAAMDIGGESGWPDVHSVYKLMCEYYTEGRRAFITEKQNQIIESDSAYFASEKYHYATEEEFNEFAVQHPLIYMHVDPTGGDSTKKSAMATRGPDKFCALLIGKMDDDTFVLWDMRAIACRQSQQFEIIGKLLHKYRVYRMTVEGNGGQIHYINALKRYLTELYSDMDWKMKAATQHLIMPRTIMNVTPKEDRISALEPYLDNGTIILREELLDARSDFKELANELDDWPNSEFDDALDAFSNCFFSAFRTFRFANLYNG